MTDNAGDDLPEAAREYFRKIGRDYGALGGKKTAERLTATQRKRNAKKAGKAAAAKLTPAERSERAKAAAKARWGEKGGKGNEEANT